jgi:hypothetical protein
MNFCYNLKSLEERQQGREREVPTRKGVLKESVTLGSIVGNSIGINEEFGTNRC